MSQVDELSDDQLHDVAQVEEVDQVQAPLPRIRVRKISERITKLALRRKPLPKGAVGSSTEKPINLAY